MNLVKQVLNGAVDSHEAFLGADMGVWHIQPGPKLKPLKLKDRAILLQRTFTMCGERFWRVVSPWHKSYQSDLSIQGLKDWGIL
jgi:hypothetical protein